jgi:hypothetical protein
MRAEELDLLGAIGYLVIGPLHTGNDMTTSKIPKNWEKWCTTGRHGRGARKKNAVRKCLSAGHVRGYFSDVVLRPDLDATHSMYPSLEHLSGPKNHAETVVEARIVNDMKSHLSESEQSSGGRTNATH